MGQDINGINTLVSVSQNIVTALNQLNQTIAAVFPPALTSSATYNPGAITNATQVTTTITVSGAVLGNYVTVGFTNNISGIILTAYVSAANTITVVFRNDTGGTVTLGSGTLTVWVRSK